MKTEMERKRPWLGQSLSKKSYPCHGQSTSLSPPPCIFLSTSMRRCCNPLNIVRDEQYTRWLYAMTHVIKVVGSIPAS